MVGIWLVKRPSIKHLSIRRRYLGMTALQSIQVKKIETTISILGRIYTDIKYTDQDVKKRKIKRAVSFLLRDRQAIVTPPIELTLPLPQIIRQHRTIDSFDDNDIPIHFRFRSKQQLYDLIIGLQIPDRVGNFFDKHVFIHMYI